MGKHFTKLPRSAFIARLKHFVHPSEEVSIPDQLVGRDANLSSLRDCFETSGAHPFVWGERGVGKTSLVHSACAKYEEIVQLAAAVGCQGNSSVNGLFNDIFRRVINGGKVNIKDKSYINRLGAFGFSIDGQLGGFRESIEISSINHASDFLKTVLPPDYIDFKEWVIIMDEFDQLKNNKTIDFFTSLLKQVSVDGLPIKFAFCGVASNLNDLIGSHISVERYIHSVPLRPLPYDGIKEITRGIFANFDLQLTNGQEWRVTQIACGYPHFAHLICREILTLAYDQGFCEAVVSPNLYKEGIQRASERAATRLQVAYEKATLKGSNKYVEVLWAAADGQHLEKQFKTIADDYNRIMESFPDRPRLTQNSDLRNYLNNLCKETHGYALRRRNPGWYRFVDPMLRSYVRMVAHSEGADLGDESFRD